MKLTPEQRMRLELNRQLALERKKKKLEAQEQDAEQETQKFAKETEKDVQESENICEEGVAKNDQEYTDLLFQALGDIDIYSDGEGQQCPGMPSNLAPKSEAVTKDPYDFGGDSMDEGEDDDDEDGSTDSDDKARQSRGRYALIEYKCAAVQEFTVSDMGIEDFVAANGTKFIVGTLSKWIESCRTENWPDFLAQCSAEEKAKAKKVPNWYRHVANAMALSEAKETPFPAKLGRTRYRDKHEYMTDLVLELAALVKQRRALREKVGLPAAMHTLRKMVKEKD